ncbi:MAG: DegV family protein [Clostridiales bacterium]|nr:DegV family protein [Clostridiales bacterium]
MILSTDSTANLPQGYYEELDIKMIPLQIILNDDVYNDLSEELVPSEFYDKMKKGATPKTAQINREVGREYFEELLSSGEDVLHISLSSALSGNTDTMFKIAEDLNKTHSNKLVIIDSLNAAMGEGLLVLEADKMRKQGMGIDEIAEKLNKIKFDICSFFTVDQLKYLMRGGRISKVTALIGSLLSIKPVLKVDETGHLVAHKKVISRKKSLQELARICLENMASGSDVFICHAESMADAKVVADLVEKEINKKPIICDLTQVIGCHTGPDLISIFFRKK